MKKITVLAVLLILMLSLAACGNSTSNEVMDKMIAANDFDSLLEKYGSISHSQVYNYEEGNAESYYYNDSENHIIDQEDYHYWQCGDESFGYFQGHYWYGIMTEGSEALLEDAHAAMQPFSINKDEVFLSSKEEDGKLLVITETAFTYSKDSQGKVITTYTLDPETYEIQKLNRDMELEDGSARENFEELTVTYTAEWEKNEDMSAHFLEESDQKRTVTLIVDPGTAKEKTYTGTANNDIVFRFFNATGEVSVFEDPEFSLPYTEGNYADELFPEELTLYTFKDAPSPDVNAPAVNQMLVDMDELDSGTLQTNTDIPLEIDDEDSPYDAPIEYDPPEYHDTTPEAK